jgi:hypothetical protein
MASGDYGSMAMEKSSVGVSGGVTGIYIQSNFILQFW